MFRLTVRGIILLVTGLVVFSTLAHADEPGQSEREVMYYRYLEFASYVKGGSIEPHWMADGSSFWYADSAPEDTIIYKVDPKTNTKTPLFDAVRLRRALTVLLGHEPSNRGIPFDKFTFVDDRETAVKFIVEDKEYVLLLDTHTITRAPVLSEAEKSREVPQVVRRGFFAQSAPVMEVLSPDRRWFAGVKDHNLTLRATDDDRSVQITTDGLKDYEWDVNGAMWSPDSFKLALKKVDSRKVHSIPIVHWLKPTEEVQWQHYSKAGGPLPQPELLIVDILSKRQVLVDTGNKPDQHIHIIGWRTDGAELIFARMGREHKKLDLMAANPATGSTRLVLSETQKTFVLGIEFLFVDSLEWHRLFTFLEDGTRFIWRSERDGWKHFYLYDIDGRLIRQLTEGTFPVVRVEAVDEKGGWLFFSAHGDPQRPYDEHLYRVNLEGKGFTRLTEATGYHWPIHLTPSKEFFLDTHSTVDRPPTVELRRVNGMLLQTLSKANIEALRELQWSPPEEFVVKAADGETDLYGVVYKPYDFDPNKKYPVIEYIYAGPQTFVMPDHFIHWPLPQAMSQLGFIVFMVDGRGTPGRGKEFQDVVYGNFGRNEIPDHVAVLKQLAEKRPYMDLNRVGIFGHSWGGYFAIRAMLIAPDVYHVGIASAPGVALDDFRRSVEPYMGLPQNNKEAYEYGSNLRLVGNLKGKLLLIHGTSDDDILFSSTMKMVDALIRAGKPHDLIVLPEQHHSPSGTSLTYRQEAIRRYFQEHLKP